jgi:hypothetical protein
LIKTSKAKKFSCVHCGTPFEVYPPDDEHPRASLEKPKASEVAGSIIEMTYDCKNKNCLKPTTLYWYRQKMDFSVG